MILLATTLKNKEKARVKVERLNSLLRTRAFFAPPPGLISNRIYQGFAKLYELRPFLDLSLVCGFFLTNQKKQGLRLELDKISLS